MTGDAMTQPAKFDFGTVFDNHAEQPFGMTQEKERTWTEAEVEQEKALAFAEGSKTGHAEALGTIENKLSQELGQLIVRAGEITTNLATIETRLVAEARLLALTVGRAVASELLAQSHCEEIETIVSDALALLTHQPHVVVRVHENLLEDLKTRLETIAEQRGFAGKLILLGEPDLDRSDCRIEWAEGGIARDVTALQAEIDSIVARHLAPGSTDTEQDDLFSYMAESGVPPHAETEEATT